MRNKSNKKDNPSNSNLGRSFIQLSTFSTKPEFDLNEVPKEIPILALRSAVVFPGAICAILVGREKSVKLIEDLKDTNNFFASIPQYDIEVNDPQEEHLYQYGTLTKIIRVDDRGDGSLSVLIHGYCRVKLDKITSYDPYMKGNVTCLIDKDADEKDKYIQSLVKSIKEEAMLAIKDSNIPHKEFFESMYPVKDLGFLTNFIATTIEADDFKSKIELLQYDEIQIRAIKLLEILSKQASLAKLRQEINDKVRFEMDQQQREYYLNNQLKTIQEELGIGDGDEISNFKEEADKKEWPEEIKNIFLKEVTKLEKYNPSSPDYSIQLNYLKFFIGLPWDKVSKDNLDLKHAQKILDADHFGLEKVKERILEYLAVLKLKGNMKSPILCLYGAPGVGKTSLGKSIARALGRKYIRIALGGMHDEAEIRGHRKTYIGAMAGRILAGISKAGTSNPVIVLDEIDKLSNDIKGDPSSALLEALDPEQNTTFHDNYLDQDYDLSKVLFITTANTTSTIQPALLDRMELINVSGYLAEEKEEIAKKHLIPKQLEEHGLGKKSLKIDKAALRDIIENYTRESGVRGLDKQIAKIARKTAKKIALEQEVPSVILKKDLKEYLGMPINSHDKQEGNEAVGVVTGLAWTAVGGEILFIETSVSEGKGILTMTGNLGDVMKESSTIAYQYIKAHPQIANLTSEELAKKDIHVHVPEGAVPKDGPSAGITMVTSMVSALRGTQIKSKVAMTGEMTLRGKVLPVGGIKEKILAAKRAGINTIIISEDNRRDIEDINEIYIKGLTFIYVKNIEEVIKNVFE